MKTNSVLIIGAGAAGLAAAQRLTAAGVDVVVLESRDRIGGRIHTLHASWPAPIEAGPEFIHGESPDFKRLLAAAGAATHELPDRHFRFAGGKPQRIDFDHAWGEILKQLQQSPDSDRSFADFLDKHCGHLSPDDRTMAIEYVEGFNAADHRLISVQWL